MLQLALYYAHSTTTIQERFIIFFLLVKPDNQYSYIWLPHRGPPTCTCRAPLYQNIFLHVCRLYRCFHELCTNMSNKKFRSRHLVGKKMQHCTGKRKNHGAGRCLGKIWDQFLWNQLSRDQLLRKFNFSQDQLLFIEREYTVQLLLSSAQIAWESACTLQQAQVIELFARPPGCISWCGW